MNSGQKGMQSPQPKTSSLKATLRQSCDSLKYGTYIKINVTGDLSLLTISGEPTEEELSSSWRNILSELSDIIKTEKSVSIFEAWKKVQYFQTKIRVCDKALLFFQSDCYDEELAAQLFEYGFDYIRFNGDVDDFRRQVNIFESESKTVIVFLNQAIAEYKKLCPDEKQKEFTKRTEVDYERELMILRKSGYKVNKKKDSLLVFAGAVNAFIEEQKILKHASRK